MAAGNDRNTRTVTEARKLLDLAYRTRTPIFMMGAPGVGKTGLVKAIAAEHGLPCEVLTGSAYAATDLQGLPVVDTASLGTDDENVVVKWAAPQFAKAARDGILFLDEITSANANVQAVMLRLVLERRLDTFDLGDAWVVGAGNTGDQATGYGELTAPLVSRALVFQLTPSVSEVVNGFRFGWGDGKAPFAWMKTEEDFAAVGMIATVIESSGMAVASDDMITSGDPYYTPRSWETAAKFLAHIPLSDVATLEHVLQSTVGPAATAATIAVLGGDILPTPTDVLSNPHVVDALPRLDQRRAAINGGLSHGMFHDDVDGIVSIVEWLNDQPERDVAMSILREFPAFYSQRIQHDATAQTVWDELHNRLSTLTTERLDEFRTLVEEGRGMTHTSELETPVM